MSIFSTIPFPYRVGLFVLWTVLISGSSGWYGYTKGSAKSESVISKYEAKVSDLQSKLDTKQVEIVEHVITKYVTKVVHIKDVGEHNENAAHTVVPDTGILSNGWVSVHNAAATNQKVDSTSAADGTPSGIKATDALATVTENYAAYNSVKAKLEALQQYITETNASIDAENAAIVKKHWGKQ